MASHKNAITIAAALALVTAGTAWAKSKDLDAGAAPPAAYQAVLNCRTLADTAQRLACYDKAVGDMALATEKKDVVVIDRSTIQATKRGLFGISLPQIKIFGANDDVDVNQIESTIAAVFSSRDDMSVFVLDDGSRWTQTEGRFTFPKVGQKILVKRGALGGFMANVNGQAAVRVMRTDTH